MGTTTRNEARCRRTWLDWKEEGREAYRAGDYQKALKAYQTALDPMYECAATTDRQVLLSNVVACRLQLGQAAEALSEAQACVQLDPSWPKGHVRLAAVYIAIGGRSNEACNELQTALRLDPSNKTARAMLVQELRRDRPPPPQNPAYMPSTTRNDNVDTSGGGGSSNNNNNTNPSSSNTTTEHSRTTHIDIDDDSHDHTATTWQTRWQDIQRLARAWYHTQSPETIRNVLWIGSAVVLVLLMVLFSSSQSSNSGSQGSTQLHGNYGANNAYEAYYRQRGASSSHHHDHYDQHAHHHHRSYGGEHPSRYDDSYSYSYSTSGGSWSSLLYLAGLAYVLHLQGINPLHALFLLPHRRRMWGGGGMWGHRGGVGGGYRRRRPFGPGGGIFFLVCLAGLVSMTTATASSHVPTVARAINFWCIWGRGVPSSSHRFFQTILSYWSALTMVCFGGVVVCRMRQKRFFTDAYSRSAVYGHHRRSSYPVFSLTERCYSQRAPSGYDIMFDLNLKEGRCVGLRIDDIRRETGSKDADFAPGVTYSLHPDEVKYARQLSSESTQKSFLGGRLALRHAMGCGINDCIILKDLYGRPSLPSSVLGSVSHKGDVAVALVADSVPQSCPPMGIGVDLEVRQGGHEGIARRILTPHERESLGKLALVNSSEEVLLRFSIKEALYKAMHPLICQYVGFQEAECHPLDDGAVQVHLNLASGAHNAFATVSASWRIMDDYFLTTAQVQLKPNSQSMAVKDPEEYNM